VADPHAFGLSMLPIPTATGIALLGGVTFAAFAAEAVGAAGTSVSSDAGSLAILGGGGIGIYVLNRLATVVERLLAVFDKWVTAHTEGKLNPFTVDVRLHHTGTVHTGSDDDPTEVSNA